jgi:hypothetical protein
MFVLPGRLLPPADTLASRLRAQLTCIKLAAGAAEAGGP